MSAEHPTTDYDLSGLELGDYEIKVIAKASDRPDSDSASVVYKARILAIGLNDPSYVLAIFNDDITSVTIKKNGAESDGLM